VHKTAWLGLCLVLGGLAAVGWFAPRALWDWQPGLAWSQPWRWFSAAGVHWSALHLGANALGLLMVALLGQRAGCQGRAALAWALAWPLGQLGLLLQPQVAHYGGLSGVLHAGVAVACCQLLASTRVAQRRIGALLAAGLIGKVLLEAPWRTALVQPAGWDIAVAPLAHASGVLAGGLLGGLLLLMPRRRPPGPPRPYHRAPMSDRKTELDALAMGLLLLCCALWGLNQVAAKITLQHVPPLVQAGLRSLVAAAMVALWAG
jgi:rhomboid family GlyGly-CTERM serine protease